MENDISKYDTLENYESYNAFTFSDWQKSKVFFNKSVHWFVKTLKAL